MYGALPRAVRLVIAPGKEWRLIAIEAQARTYPPGYFALSLACIPAISWMLKPMLFVGGLQEAVDGADPSLERLVGSGLVVYLCLLLSVLVLAAAIYALAPLFVPARHWPSALRIASYSAAPVFLGGVVLIAPNLAFALLLPVIHSFYLLYVGLQYVMGVKETSAAEYVALSTVILIMASTIMGAVGSALGLL